MINPWIKSTKNSVFTSFGIQQSNKMLRIFLTIVFCVQLQTISVDAARILGVFPVPSISHQIVFRALMLELSKHGHELVIITPNPALPKERPPDNITEIDTSAVYQLMARSYDEAQGMNLLKKGIVWDIDSVLTGHSDRGMTELISYQMDLPEVKALLEDKTQKFDLIFVEAIANYHLIVTNVFKAPVIWFSSFYGFPEHYHSIGAVAWHPTFHPYFYRQKYSNLTLLERIQEIYLEWKIFQLIKTIEEHDDNKLRQRFGPETPAIEDLKKNIQVMFVNSHPLFGGNRPVPPSVVYLGALHLQEVKDLPKELQSYLDNSSRGVIYVSFGSNVRPSMMDSDLLEVFLKTFELLPYDVLWKFDSDTLENVPKNVMIQKWFPQRDLLHHTNIKLFITQGGLQSIDEAIDANVPLVGIPMLTDQWYNVNKCVELGIAEQVDVLTMTIRDLERAVLKVVTDDSYRQNIKKLHAIINDQPQTPLERAVWWTEHVLRHGSALHLRAPSANATWTEHFMADVILVIFVVTTLAFLIIVIAAFKIIIFVRRNSNLKLKLIMKTDNVIYNILDILALTQKPSQY